MAKKKKKGRRKTKNPRRTVLLEQESGGGGGGGPRNNLVANAPEDVADAQLPNEEDPLLSTIHQLAQRTATTTVKHGVMAISSRKRKTTEYGSQEHPMGSMRSKLEPERNHQKGNSKKRRREDSETGGDCPSNKDAANFPYPVDPDDHCETPAEAFRDIVGLLSQLGTLSSLRVYDPYFCDGAVIKHLQAIGFQNVYNQKEDCYECWSATEGWMTQFDVLVTNPPYSGNHIEMLMQFVTSRQKFGNRPWFLLMPQWVHKKDYFLESTKDIQPFFVVPRKRYVYLPPIDFREAKKSDVHKKSSPFTSMWFCWGGTHEMNERMIRDFRRQHCKVISCDIARSKSALRDLRRRNLK